MTDLRKGVLLACALALSVAPTGVRANGPAIVAGPGAYLTTFATQAMVWTEGTALSFVNADIQNHDVTSDATRAPGSIEWCPAGGPRCPAFRSASTPVGGISVVEGLEDLPTGIYPFHCSPHPWMRATLVVI